MTNRPLSINMAGIPTPSNSSAGSSPVATRPGNSSFMTPCPPTRQDSRPIRPSIVQSPATARPLLPNTPHDERDSSEPADQLGRQQQQTLVMQAIGHVISDFKTPEQVSWTNVTSEYPQHQAREATLGLTLEFPKLETAHKQAHRSLTEDEKKSVQRQLTTSGFITIAKHLDQVWDGPGWVPPEVRRTYTSGEVPQKVITAMRNITKNVRPGGIEMLHSLWGSQGILRRKFIDTRKFTGPLAHEASTEIATLLAKGGLEAVRTAQLQDTTAAPSLAVTEVTSTKETPSNIGDTSERSPPITSTSVRDSLEDVDYSGSVTALSLPQIDNNPPPASTLLNPDVTPNSFTSAATAFAQDSLEDDQDYALAELSPPLETTENPDSSVAALSVLESAGLPPISESLFDSTCDDSQMPVPPKLTSAVSSSLGAGTPYSTDLKRKRFSPPDLIDIEDQEPRASRPRMESSSLNPTKVRQQLSSKVEMTDDVLDLLCHAAMSKHSQKANSIVLAPPTWFYRNSSDTALPSRLREYRDGKTICFPIHDSRHWAFGILSPTEKGFYLCCHDSFPKEGRYNAVATRVRAWLDSQGHANKRLFKSREKQMCHRQSDDWSCGIRSVCCFSMYLQGKICQLTVIPENEQHLFLHCLETLDTAALSNFPKSYVPILQGLSNIESGILAETNGSTSTASTDPTPHAIEMPPGPATSPVTDEISTAHTAVTPPLFKSEAKSTAAILYRRHLSRVTFNELEHRLSAAKQRQKEVNSAERTASESVLVLKTQLAMGADLVRKRDSAVEDLKDRLDRSHQKASGEDNFLDGNTRKEPILDNIIASANEDLLKERHKQLFNGAKFMSACLVGHSSALEDKVQAAQEQLLDAQREIEAANKEMEELHGEIKAKKKLEELTRLEAQSASLKGELEQWWTNYCQ